MRYLMIIIGLATLTSQLQAQSIYEDVLRLEKYVQPSGNQLLFDEYEGDDDYISILKKYVPASARDTLNTNGSFHYYFKEVGNEFLSDYFNSQGSLHSLSTEMISAETSFPASIAGLNITTAADGLARFLVERSKEEIAITFFKHFERFFKENPEAEVLFPQTSTFLFEFDSYEYSGMLNALKTSFKNDLNNLPASIPGLESVERGNEDNKVTPYSEFFQSEKGKMVTAALDLIDPIRNGANTAEVLSLLAGNPNLESFAVSGSEYKNIPALAKTADLLSQSFRSNNSNETWVGYYEIRNLIQDDITFRIYLGLLYQQGKDIHFYTSSGSDLSYRDILAPYASKIDDIRGFYQKYNHAIQELSRTGKQLKTVVENGNTVSAEDLSLYLDSILKIYEEMISIDSRIAEHEYENFLMYAKLSLRLYQDLQQKQYTAAFFDAIALIDATGLIGSSGEEFFDMRKMRKYGLFMSSVAEARDADEVVKAIEAAVLPAGSSRIKRQTKWNVSVNSFLGGFAGKENLRESPDGNWSGTYGISAPVGVAISRGFGYGGGNKKSINSVSAFISIIDIGAFASFRIQDEVEELPEFQLQNIIAPGGYLAWNIGGTPFTMLGGAQLGPQLRKIGPADNQITSGAWRWQVAVTVDIPLFNMKTVPWN